MLEVYAVNILPGLTNQVVSEIMRIIEKPKQIQLMRLKKDDRNRSLIGALLIRTISTHKLGLNLDQLTIETNLYGKPLFKNISDFHFNISHARDWIVCCIDQKPVGIDIEYIDEIDLEIAKRIFSKEEFEYLDKLGEGEKIEAFYSLWTQKESYVKAIGIGLNMPFDSFTVRINSLPNGHNTVVGNKIQGMNHEYSKPYFINNYNLDQDYKLALCAQHNDFPEKVKRIKLSTLTALFLNILKV